MWKETTVASWKCCRAIFLEGLSSVTIKQWRDSVSWLVFITRLTTWLWLALLRCLMWFITSNQIADYSGVTGIDGPLCLSVNNLLTAARWNPGITPSGLDSELNVPNVKLSAWSLFIAVTERQLFWYAYKAGSLVGVLQATPVVSRCRAGKQAVCEWGVSGWCLN